MVILPTEKSFDWQHTPVVLISLVILNILVYFFYQSGDNAKLENAYSLYEEANLFAIEWPIYQEYLRAQGDDEKVSEYQIYVDNDHRPDVAYALLTDFEFNHYLNDNYRDVIPDADYSEWSATRPSINRIIESISFYHFGLIPNQMSAIDLVMYQFLHGDIMHLLGNMFFLLVCGFAVEAAIGHLRFLAFYLIAGVVGGLSHALVDLQSSGPLIGASGAISGVMAMYLGVFRLKKIEFFYWFFVFVGYFRAPALLILPIYIGKEIFYFISSNGDSVAYMAHVGGFVAGGLLITASLLITPQTINEEYIESDQSNNEYQEKLAKVYKAIESFQFTAALKNLNEIIQEYGLNFQLAAIRYNLAKIHKPVEYSQWVSDILSTKSREPRELAKMQQVWQENKDIAQTLDDEKNLELGLRFSNKEQFSTAESIFKTLHNKQPHHPQLSLLAHKLSEVAKQLNEPQKRDEYLQFAKSAHGAHG